MHATAVTLGVVLFVLSNGPLSPLAAQPRSPDDVLAEYFRHETETIEHDCLSAIDSLDEWQAARPRLRQQLQYMLGLDPMPERTDLKATVTGRTEHEDFVVERLQFQSLPGLYVTGNLYLPRQIDQPLPAILYLCGHGAVKVNGISYGNKVHYQHHGAWFARNGYACLTIDSLQLGEIEGTHHGTHRYGMWWWLNRGYTPAGVEAWNSIRAVDYLQSRGEVDGTRIGVTGRSGGGAYSWWIAALDDRIQAAVPVAGITDLENHVVDGCVEGHCDCMYFVNTFRWDYPLVAALVAPRPLLISNTDRDSIFPLDGVVRTYEKVRKIYRLYGAADRVALHITAGPHQDTQELRIHAFRWFNHHLKNDDSLIDKPAVPYFQPAQLQVFAEGRLPEDQINTRIHESFVSTAPRPAEPRDADQWNQQRAAWLCTLEEYVFRGWPRHVDPLDLQRLVIAEDEHVSVQLVQFTSQSVVRLPLLVVKDTSQPVRRAELHIVDETQWKSLSTRFAAGLASPPTASDSTPIQPVSEGTALVYVCPRGIGPTAWNNDERKQVQIRRRFYLLGQTLDGMRIWDVRRAIQAIRSMEEFESVELCVRGEAQAAAWGLYAALFEPTVQQVDLVKLPASHHDGPYLLNVQRYLDMPQVVAMVAEHCQVTLHQEHMDQWDYPQAVARLLGWDPNQLDLVALPAVVSDDATEQPAAGP